MLRPDQGGSKRLELLGGRGVGYREYPFAMGLVREERVRDVVREMQGTRGKVVGRLVREGGGRSGVREKVEEVVGRCCEVDRGGRVVWRG